MGQFWREMGVATTRAPNGLGPPDWVDLLGQLLPQNHVFEIFRPEKLYLEIMMWPLGGAVRWGRYVGPLGEQIFWVFRSLIFWRRYSATPKYGHQNRLKAFWVLNG